MSTVTEQYTEFIEQSKAAAAAARETWTKSVTDAFSAIPTTVPAVPATFSTEDFTAAVDKAYDFAVQAIQTQRELAKKVISTSAEAAQTGLHNA